MALAGEEEGGSRGGDGWADEGLVTIVGASASPEADLLGPRGGVPSGEMDGLMRHDMGWRTGCCGCCGGGAV